jgi:PAS domain S-box-containing protein
MTSERHPQASPLPPPGGGGWRLWSALRALRRPRRSVRGKLVGMVLLTTVIVLAVSAVAFVVYDLAVYRSSWAGDVATEANILALSTAPAMAFDDRDAANHNLAALRARDSVLAAGLYRPDGSLYAEYLHADARPVPPRAPAIAGGLRINGERVEIAQPITYNNEFLGTIYLRARYDVVGRVRAYLGIFSFISVLGVAIALLLSASLQQAVSGPLEAIAEVARQIVHRRDYSLRVAAGGDDEIGIVVQALNRMLDEVQARAQALEKSNALLQEEVHVRQAAETALAHANARLESTMGAAEIGSWVWDLRARHLTVDRNFAALFGFADAGELNRDAERWRSLIDADDLRALDESATAALRGGTLSSAEFRIRRPDHSLRWVVARGKVQFDDAGAPRLLAGLLIDITAQKHAEQELRESEKIYRAIGESIDYGVWLTDAQGRTTYASESYLRLTGLSQEECSEFGWRSVMHPDEEAETLAAWQECVRSGTFWYREHRVRDVDGKYHPVLAQGAPIRGEDGSIYAWAGINLDISRLKQTEEALREADRRKDEFLATLAHELRNPLAPIRQAAHLLGSENASDAQRRWGREVIARQVRHMALLLDDLLDVSRITRGRLELKKQPVLLSELVTTAVETARPLIDAKQHRLRIELPPQAVELNVDPLRISQALTNLLNNAAKFTDGGGCIVLSACVDAGGVTLAVADNGIGLSAQALSRVFEMFAQVDEAGDRSQGGLGIGLALAQGLVALHEGRLEVASDGPGHGSTFTVWLPASAVLQQAAAPETATSPKEAPAGTGSRVLVVDDNADGADSLAMLLSLLGHEVTTAYSGREALALAARLQPAVAIVDIGMPDLSGYEVAECLRAQPGADGLTLIALTGWGQQEDIERALASGFDRHFRKPVDMAELDACLGDYARRRHAPAGIAGTTDAG